MASTKKLSFKTSAFHISQKVSSSIIATSLRKLYSLNDPGDGKSGIVSCSNFYMR